MSFEFKIIANLLVVIINLILLIKMKTGTKKLVKT